MMEENTPLQYKMEDTPLQYKMEDEASKQYKVKMEMEDCSSSSQSKMEDSVSPSQMEDNPKQYKIQITECFSPKYKKEDIGSQPIFNMETSKSQPQQKMEESPPRAQYNTHSPITLMDNNPASNHSTSNSSDSEEPKDLSMNHHHKTVKKLKPIPPPLDLSQSSQILDCSVTGLKSGSSSGSANSSPSHVTSQKNLPFRKRAHCSTLSGHSPSLSPLKEPPPLDSPPSSGSCTTPSDHWRSHLISSNTSDLIYSSHPAHHPMYSHQQRGTNNNFGDIKHPDLSSLRHSQSMSTILDPHHSLQRLSYQLSPLWYPSSALLSPAPSSLGSSREELNWNLPWSPPVWHCFMSGTLIQIPKQNHQWLLVDDLANSRIVFDWPGRLRIKQLISNSSNDTHTIVFSSCEGELVAQCRNSHMFYDKDRGWSCLEPDTAAKLYGGGPNKYRPLQVNDTVFPVPSPGVGTGSGLNNKLPLLSPHHHGNVLSPDLCDRMKRFSFPVSDESPSPSFIPPTSLHSHPPSLFAFPILSPPTTPTHKDTHHPSAGGGGGGSSDKPKRPMNAFMLFAKQFRLELIQNNPGKDNRAISVLLGEAWKSLPQEHKDLYVNEAKTLAQEQKSLYPDCWKRKRSHSTS
uniref:HMG box-containing protein 1 n=1 Tax=Cacopsylla melanoneura TaxID=428564 RepID=A0A8D8QDB0_9HEMI